MKRYKSIDTIRGLSMILMIAGHLGTWWLTPEDHWLFEVLASIFAPIGATGFVFASGTVTFLSYQKSQLKPEALDKLYQLKIRNIYLLRSFFLLVISCFYNLGVAILYSDYTLIWSWNILQTIGFSLIIAWPFLKTSKTFRIIMIIIILIVNEFILAFLINYESQANLYGILFHILYNPLMQYPILPYFSIFLLGTVIGDLILKVNRIDNIDEKKTVFKRNFMYPIIISGIFLTCFGIWYLYPSFSYWYTISATLFSIGIILILISVLIGIEEFNVFKFKQNHRFFFFYSYYSFTIYLAHNLLYFLFFQQLNIITIWIPVIVTIIIISVLLKITYDKLGPKASLKYGITIISFIIATKIENRKKRKILNNTT